MDSDWPRIGLDNVWIDFNDICEGVVSENVLVNPNDAAEPSHEFVYPSHGVPDEGASAEACMAGIVLEVKTQHCATPSVSEGGEPR